MSTFKNYLSLVKFSHTIFAMPFAMIGYFTAVLRTGHGFSWLTFLLVIGCMVFARSAAMAFNRWLDAHFDALNPRTAIREIPAGIISRSSALWFVIACCMLFIGCTYLINPLCFYLSPVALFVVLFYSYTKRFTALCHLVLGLGLSLAPIGAYLAVTGTFAWLPVLFSFAVVFWVSGFDVIYALQDESFDKAQKLHSMPAAFGVSRALRLSELLHVLSASSVIAAGIYGHFGFLYWIGVAVFAGMLVAQHRLVKPGDLSKVNLAFMTTNGIASVVFAVFVVTDLFMFRAPL
jgi:4-hydroxybenzoate polyprenyltransferase